jgi:ABC-type cobalamin transport system permease subunit
MGHAGGATEQEIIAQASCQAIARSGLRKADIDGIITASLGAPLLIFLLVRRHV